MNKEKIAAEARKVGWALTLADQNGDIDYTLAEDVRYLIECINKLDEPEITEEQAWNEEIARLSDYLLRNFEKEIGGDRNYETPVDAAIRILGEKRKPVIPQFITDWIEECKEVKHNLYGVLDFAPTDVEEWLFHTPEKSERVDLIARAWLYGYEVEKEQVYQVIFPDGSNLVSEAVGDFDNKNTFIGQPGDMGIHSFTEKTIKNLDPRYWAFAQEVTE